MDDYELSLCDDYDSSRDQSHSCGSAGSARQRLFPEKAITLGRATP